LKDFLPFPMPPPLLTKEQLSPFKIDFDLSKWDLISPSFRLERACDPEIPAGRAGARQKASGAGTSPGWQRDFQRDFQRDGGLGFAGRVQ